MHPGHLDTVHSAMISIHPALFIHLRDILYHNPLVSVGEPFRGGVENLFFPVLEVW